MQTAFVSMGAKSRVSTCTLKALAIFWAQCEFLGLGDCRVQGRSPAGFAVGLLTLAGQGQTGERFGFQSVPDACAQGFLACSNSLA